MLLPLFLPAHTAAGLNNPCMVLTACLPHMLVNVFNPAVKPPQVLDQDYDWVFGSDVTYCDEMLLPLAKLMRQLVLTGEQSSVIKLAHMHRNKDLDKAMREAFRGTFKSGAGRQAGASTGCGGLVRGQHTPWDGLLGRGLGAAHVAEVEGVTHQAEGAGCSATTTVLAHPYHQQAQAIVACGQPLLSSLADRQSLTCCAMLCCAVQTRACSCGLWIAAPPAPLCMRTP